MVTKCNDIVSVPKSVITRSILNVNGQSIANFQSSMRQGSVNKIWVTAGAKKQAAQRAENKFFQEIRPLLLLLRLLGRFPYSLNDQGLDPFKLFSYPVLYTVVFFIVQTGWTIYSILVLLDEKIYKAHSYTLILYWIALGLFLLFNFAVPFTYWPESGKIVKYVAKWKHFQDEHMSSGLKLKLTRAVRFTAILTLPISVSLMFLETYLLTDLSVVIFIPFLLATYPATISLIIWCTTLCELRSISNQLQNKIIRDGCRRMSIYRQSWLYLSDLVSGVGEIQGFTGLTTAILIFASFVLTMYALFAHLFQYRVINNNLWGLVISSSISFTTTCIMSDAAHRTTQEVGVNFSSKILTSDLTHLSQSEVGEISLLLQTVSANQPIISFLGFVTINRTVMVSFISNTVTYLIVLIQFKDSSNGNPFGGKNETQMGS